MDSLMQIQYVIVDKRVNDFNFALWYWAIFVDATVLGLWIY